MNTACHYAIVRFMPFVETGEFANVGVVMLFAVNGPEDATARGKARREVVGELESAGVTVSRYGYAQAVIDFAGA